MVSIRILIDDNVADTRPMGLQAEHGFSAIVDDVLFDTGQSEAAAANARRMDLGADFEEIVLSHGHYDHTGGLPAFLSGGERVYAHPDIFQTKILEGTYIGTPHARDAIEAEADLVLHSEPVEVRPGMYALGEIPREYPDNPIGEVVESDGSTRPDGILDDQSLALETGKGTVLVCGCCHAGLRNTVEYAETVTDDEVRAIVGGTHFTAMDPEEIHEVADWLGDRPDLIATSHCTGHEGERIIESRFPDAFEFIGVGSEIVW